jgi:protein-glutamine gamma-glutamyltransferase
MEAGTVHLARTRHPAAPAATGPVAAPFRARLLAFVPLALFGALHWGALVSPGAGGALLGTVAAATAGGAALLLVPAGASRTRRLVPAAAVCVALLAVAVLAAQVPARFLLPGHWDELVGNLLEGSVSLPAVTVPYRGVDEWVRSATLFGGTVLTGLAAILAFWPRAGGGRGLHLTAAVALGALYTVPIVEDGPQRPFLGGMVFCMLFAGFLWLERLRGDQVAVGIACVALATVAGAIVAPKLDGGEPWLDYQAIAEDLEPEKAATFTWDHGYGPLRWPRDGREVLRIKAPAPTYWKTVNLDEFDGLRWKDSGPKRINQDVEFIRPQWLHTIRVIDRGLRSSQIVGAGTTLQVLPGGPSSVSISPGTFVALNKPIEPGTSYAARVYIPRPTPAQLRKAPTLYPGFTTEYLDMDVPSRDPRFAPKTIQFPSWGVPGGPDRLYANGFEPRGGTRVLRASPYERMYALARRLQAAATTPYDFVQRVLERVEGGATYSETPPPSRVPLVDFLFRDKLGYCQQFSGAMALLLRMGGVPARVASGFSPGRFDRKRGQYIIRDDDAHSWVEAYFPRYGWVTFDPTPAASPARSQLTDSAGPTPSGPRPDLPVLGQAGDRPFATGDPRTALAPVDGGDGWRLPTLAAALALLLAGATLRIVRRGRLPGPPLAPELAELQRALHRSRRTPPAHMTLRRLEELLGGSDAARGYLRALRDQRFAGGGPGPTAAQRRALRRELGAGLGLRGRLRGYWALPPKLPPRP